MYIKAYKTYLKENIPYKIKKALIKLNNSSRNIKLNNPKKNNKKAQKKHKNFPYFTLEM